MVCTVGMVLLAVGLWPAGGKDVLPGKAPGAQGGPPYAAPAGTAGGHRRRRWSRRRTATALEPVLAELVAVLAPPLRAGVAPVTAIAAAEPAFASDSAFAPLLRELRSAAAVGESVADVWLAHAATWGSPDLRFVGQAWSLTERTGAPLADALASAERVLRARARGRQRLAVASAGPRASMRVLCLLPLSGPLVGAAFGMSPAALYLSSPVAFASVVVGVILATASWFWSRRIIASAT
jgi:tight adherence protein B